MDRMEAAVGPDRDDSRAEHQIGLHTAHTLHPETQKARHLRIAGPGLSH